MKYLVLLIALFFVKPLSAQDDLTKKEVVNIQTFIKLIKIADKEKLAAMTQYPLLVKYGKVKVANRADFVKKFNLIFDKELRDYIVSFDESEWSRVGSKGLMFRAGEVWLNEGGTKLITVNGNFEVFE